MTTKKKSAGIAPDAPSTGVLKLRLGKCLTMTGGKLCRELHRVARAMNQARNRMARAWHRYVEDHPSPKFPSKVPGAESVDEVLATATEDKRVTVLKRDGTLVSGKLRDITRKAFGLEDGNKVVQTVLRSDALGFVKDLSTHLYHCARSEQAEMPPGALPIAHVHSQLISAGAQAVVKRLRSEMPYNHEGTAKFRWQAILWNECNLESYRNLLIPVPNQDAVLGYAGHMRPGGRATKPMQEFVRPLVSDACVLLFPLFSAAAGRSLWHACRLDVGALPSGYKAILKRMARGEWKMADSNLVWHEARPNSQLARSGRDGEWFLHLTYQQPAGECSLDAGRVASLWLQDPEAKHPFSITEPGGRSWQVGQGPLLRTHFGRIEARRSHMKKIYKLTGSGRRGHGHQRVHRDIRALTERGRNSLNTILARTAAEVVRFCQRHDCGTLEWQAPAKGYRPHCWFSKAEVPWDWTLFESKLNHACQRARIVVVPPTARQAAEG